MRKQKREVLLPMERTVATFSSVYLFILTNSEFGTFEDAFSLLTTCDG